MAIYYAKQPHCASCGPTSIINIGKWAGNLLSMRNDYTRIYRSTGCSNQGTPLENIEIILQHELSYAIKFTKCETPKLTIETMKKHIENNGSVLFYYCFNDEARPHGIGSHIALFTKVYKNYWLGHNVDTNEANSWVTQEQMEQYMNSPDANNPTTAWLISRKGLSL